MYKIAGKNSFEVSPEANAAEGLLDGTYYNLDIEKIDSRTWHILKEYKSYYVVVADMGREVVFLDHLAHVFPDGFRRGDGLPRPGLEAIAKGVEIAVGANTWVFVGEPGAAEAALRF